MLVSLVQQSQNSNFEFYNLASKKTTKVEKGSLNERMFNH